MSGPFRAVRIGPDYHGRYINWWLGDGLLIGRPDEFRPRKVYLFDIATQNFAHRSFQILYRVKE